MIKIPKIKTDSIERKVVHMIDEDSVHEPPSKLLPSQPGLSFCNFLQSEQDSKEAYHDTLEQRIHEIRKNQPNFDSLNRISERTIESEQS